LVESELFGHEKGAFTGALARKPGKFELADRGTLFLDEIGDLPPEAQAKLLRVLQEREVQRVGGTRPVPVNVRLIAATNQDLEQCIRTARFRQDLFYRLSVFPLRLPPLRERPEDIPPLVSHFVKRFAERQHKAAPQVSREAMDLLTGYDWPGNVRELQNIIERAVILARGGVIGRELIPVRAGIHRAIPSEPEAIARPEPPAGVSSTGVVVAFSEAERRAILRALDLTGWRISGRGGAAEALGLKPTTLHAKMKKLGIHRPCAQHVS
jgi:transcriptional regulator with GAF, ATPase, and Fis domain